MFTDDRLYAFIVAGTSRSRSHIRRICIHKRWLKISAGAICLVLCVALYGLYGAYRAIARQHLEQENNRLRAENEKQRRMLNSLKFRVDAIEDTSRRIATEITGETEGQNRSAARGAGGPLLLMDEDSINNVETRAAQLEQELRAYEQALRERARVPSIWPVAGELTDRFGGRRDPFGSGGSEFHAGQDIAALSGTPVFAAGDGTVSFAGYQNGYGQVVIVDHGNGLATRYGHLSKIEAAAGQQLKRGAALGRVGSTGRSTGPHLHYEVRINDQPVNPRTYLPDESEGADDYVSVCAQP
ncbi:MAG: peptidoglycan DD-metalloendopeptidase family protein [Pyrinomonadaceae bacterium]